MAVASLRKWTFHPTAARKSLTGPGARGQNGSYVISCRCFALRAGAGRRGKIKRRIMDSTDRSMRALVGVWSGRRAAAVSCLSCAELKRTSQPNRRGRVRLSVYTGLHASSIRATVWSVERNCTRNERGGGGGGDSQCMHSKRIKFQRSSMVRIM